MTEPSGGTPLLELRDLRVSYGKAEVVHGISLRVDAGTIATVIGANGAGKTTLLNATMGVVPSAGAILFQGQPAPRSVEGRVQAGMCLVPERRELFGSMSVEDNLELGGFLRTVDERRETLDDVYTRFPRLAERKKQTAGTLSGGERQMLAIGRALMSRPRLLLLDEPSLGLAPLVVRQIFSIIEEINKRDGVTVLLVEQNAYHALRLAHRGYVLVNGSSTMSGSGADLLADEQIRAAYLEGGHA